MVLEAKIISPGLVAVSLVRSADAILLCVPVQTLAMTVCRLVDTPLLNGEHRTGDVLREQLEMMVPCNVCCIATPAVIPHEGSAKTQQREHCQCQQRTHNGEHPCSKKALRKLKTDRI